MANLNKKAGIYHARFRYNGKEYKRSLQTAVERDAKGMLHGIENALHLLSKGTKVPAGVDPGDFIVSGGALTAPAPLPDPTPPTVPAEPPAAPQRRVRTVRQLIAKYKKYEEPRAAETYYASQLTHLRHFRRFLGKARYNGPADKISERTIDKFLERQLLAKYDGGTVYKQSVTLRKFFAWAVANRHLAASPAIKKFEVTHGGDPAAFRTIEEIADITARGGLSDEELLKLWECLYLSPTEIAGLLALVRKNANNPHSFLLHAIPAYTGMRRGEILRLTWVDVDLRNGFITAISRKQSRSQKETRRKIVLHDELRSELEAWRKKSTKGQFVLCDSDTLAPLTPHFATRRFWQPLRGTDWQLKSNKKWFRVGFHSYRHSFASNLAAANVSQAIIDSWMGHQTVAMRKRYQHLFPGNLRAAMQVFSLIAANASAGRQGAEDAAGVESL